MYPTSPKENTCCSSAGLTQPVKGDWVWELMSKLIMTRKHFTRSARTISIELRVCNCERIISYSPQTKAQQIHFSSAFSSWKLSWSSVECRQGRRESIRHGCMNKAMNAVKALTASIAFEMSLVCDSDETFRKTVFVLFDNTVWRGQKYNYNRPAWTFHISYFLIIDMYMTSVVCWCSC